MRAEEEPHLQASMDLCKLHYRTSEPVYRAEMITNLNQAIAIICNGYEHLLKDTSNEVSILKMYLKQYDEMHKKRRNDPRYGEYVARHASDLSKVELLESEKVGKVKALVKSLELLQKPISYSILKDWKEHCLSKDCTSPECLDAFNNLAVLTGELEKTSELIDRTNKLKEELNIISNKSSEISFKAFINFMGRDLKNLFEGEE